MLSLVGRMRELRAAARSLRPVFIVGEARSGTSILYHVLQRHPSFRPKELNLHETRLLTHLPFAFLFHGRKPRRLWRYMLEDDEAYREFLRAIRPARLPLALFAIPNMLRPQSTGLLWRLSRAPDVVRCYFVIAGRARRAQRLVEKSPTAVTRSHQLIYAFPNARLLYLYRDPVQVLSSYRKRYQRDPDADWADIDLETFCRTWKRNTTAALRLARSERERVLLVRYESFTSAPYDELRRICAFLEEPFVPEALEAEEADLERWKPDPDLFGPIVTETKRWQDFVTQEEAATIRRELGPLLDELSRDDSVARYPNGPDAGVVIPGRMRVAPQRG